MPVPLSVRTRILRFGPESGCPCLQMVLFLLWRPTLPLRQLTMWGTASRCAGFTQVVLRQRWSSSRAVWDGSDEVEIGCAMREPLDSGYFEYAIPARTAVGASPDPAIALP